MNIFKELTAITTQMVVYVSSAVLSELERIITESEILKYAVFIPLIYLCSGQRIGFILSTDLMISGRMTKNGQNPIESGARNLRSMWAKLTYRLRWALPEYFCLATMFFLYAGDAYACDSVQGTALAFESITCVPFVHACTVRQNWFIVKH